MWKKFNNNPTGRAVGDCAVRAVSVALDVDWETAYELIANAGYAMGDMPSSDSVWGVVLRQRGFYRKAIPNTCPICYTFADFAEDNPRGVFVLGTGKHVATIIDGRRTDDVWPVMEELMEVLRRTNKPLYNATIRKIQD